jgi:hypothetical protein
VVDEMTTRKDLQLLQEEIRQLKEDFDDRSAEEHILVEEYKKEKNQTHPTSKRKVL